MGAECGLSVVDAFVAEQLRLMTDRELFDFVAAIQRNLLLIAGFSQGGFKEEYPPVVLAEIRRRQQERGV